MRGFALVLTGFGVWLVLRNAKANTPQALSPIWPAWLYGSAAATTAHDSQAPTLLDMSTPRGIRNNNPGNLRGSDFWLGLASPGTDPQGYRVFTTSYYGLRALAINLRNQQDRHGLNTIRGIITRFAPPTENVTASYIAAVSAAMNTPPDAIIDLHNEATLAALMQAIITHENGQQPYTVAEILNATSAFSFV